MLEQLLGIFIAHLPQLGKTALKGITLNYVDLIVPAGEQILNSLVTAEICPPQLQDYDILAKFRELQKACSSVFNAVTTEDARASWA